MPVMLVTGQCDMIVDKSIVYVSGQYTCHVYALSLHISLSYLSFVYENASLTSSFSLEYCYSFDL